MNLGVRLTLACLLAVSLAACGSTAKPEPERMYQRPSEGFCDDLRFDLFVERFGGLMPTGVSEQAGRGSRPTHECSAATVSRMVDSAREPTVFIKLSVITFESSTAAAGWSDAAALPPSTQPYTIGGLAVDEMGSKPRDSGLEIVFRHRNVLVTAMVTTVNEMNVDESVSGVLEDFIRHALNRLAA